MQPASYVTADIPGVGGRIKETPDDFLVEEIPLYTPSGEGEHVYLMVEKRAMTAMELFDLIARHFRVRRSAVGYAGLKDKQAVTRQVVSVHLPRRRYEDIPHLEHDRVRVLWADRHNNKLKRGHLTGNRFSIKIRGVGIEQTPTVLRAVRTLEQVGVPDRIGVQRFGYLGNNHLIGLALLRRDAHAAVEAMLGPSEVSPDAQREARALYAEGRFTEARDAFPRSLRTEWAVLDALACGEHPEQAIGAVQPDVLGFYISAFQSAVFNAVLDRRVIEGTLGVLREGDIAVDERGRKPIEIDEVSLADGSILERHRRFELSASGPMWGALMRRASGETGRIEKETLVSFGISPGELPDPKDLDIPMSGGTRRPLRVALTNTEVEAGSDEHGPYIRIAFDLPRGGFATTVLDEIMKPVGNSTR